MKRILLYIVTMLLLVTNTVCAISYPDVQASYEWAKEAIETLSEQAFFQGYPDGLFHPEQNITRAELAKLVCVMFGPGEAVSYADVEENLWYTPYVTKMGGYFLAEDYFFPNQHATREEVAYAIASGLKMTKIPEENATFSDLTHIQPEYLDAIHTLTASKIITGYPDGSFRPTSEITRAETAVILHRASSFEKVEEEEPTTPPEEVKKPEIKSINYFFIVEKTSQIINEDDEIVTKVVGYQDGLQQELLLNGVEIYNGNQISHTGIKPHDIITFNRDRFGNIRAVSIVVRPSEMPVTDSMDMLYYGQSTARKILAGYVKRIYKNKGIDLLSLNQATEGSYTLDPNLNVYTLNKNGKIEVSELAEITDSQYELGDKIVAYCYKDVISEILVIKE